MSKVIFLVGESIQKHHLLPVAPFIPKERTSTDNELDSLLTQEVQVMAVKSKKRRAGVSKTTLRERSCRQHWSVLTVYYCVLLLLGSLLAHPGPLVMPTCAPMQQARGQRPTEPASHVLVSSCRLALADSALLFPLVLILPLGFLCLTNPRGHAGLAVPASTLY